jgi:hypothetical protein
MTTKTTRHATNTRPTPAPTRPATPTTRHAPTNAAAAERIKQTMVPTGAAARAADDPDARLAKTATAASPVPWPTRMVHDPAAATALLGTMRPTGGSVGPDTHNARMTARHKIAHRKPA